MDDETPLGEVKQWVKDRREDGVRCPGCKCYVKVYHRSFTSGMARDLIRLYKKYGMQMVDTPSDPEMNQSKDLNKSQYWGFVVRGQGRGWWMVTPLGEQFVLGKVEVGRWAVIANNRLLEIDDSKTINIWDALNNKFSYEKLMRGE